MYLSPIVLFSRRGTIKLDFFSPPLLFLADSQRGPAAVRCLAVTPPTTFSSFIQHTLIRTLPKPNKPHISYCTRAKQTGGGEKTKTNKDAKP